jgi:DNA-binding LacI/PurR family transcriptional regulator
MITHKNDAKKSRKVTLKVLGERTGLTAGTVSVILNRAPQASSLPQRTKDRVFAAARELNYQPNLFARALRMGKTPARAAKERDWSAGSSAFMIVGAEHVLRAIHAMRKAGLRVPEDVSVVGFENIPGGVAVDLPPLSGLDTTESRLSSG